MPLTLTRIQKWDGPDADYTPESDDIPWSMVPEKKVTVEMSNMPLLPISRDLRSTLCEEQGTASKRANTASGSFPQRFPALLIQMRPDGSGKLPGSQWLAFASNAFNTLVLFYAAVDETRNTLRTPQRKFPPGEFLLVGKNDRRDGGRIFLRNLRSTSSATRMRSRRKDMPCSANMTPRAAKITDPAERQRLLEKANREIKRC